MSAEHAGGRVVVGVSARATSPGALRWAAAYAAERGAVLEVVRAWRPLPSQAGSRGTPTGVPSDPRTAEGGARERLLAEVSAVLGPESGAQVRLVTGGKRQVLAAASAGADLLVIDAPRAVQRDSGPGFVQRLVQRADCPVVVIPRALAQLPPSGARNVSERAARAMTEAAGRAPRPGMSHPRP